LEWFVVVFDVMRKKFVDRSAEEGVVLECVGKIKGSGRALDALRGGAEEVFGRGAGRQGPDGGGLPQAGDVGRLLWMVDGFVLVG
jgi:hypothetical protein